ncbi:MAG TPA: PilZ domain-containing protein [Rhizobiales bacterium]|uniref:PilZ domain-containing protein n=2 Tax=Cohaesibacter gelatinilyticus TaxID=372072 RepID=A0A285NG47_9HYPH|nr:PilZ domain-containing protein [Cohaesibacter gelatinilyticus]HAT87559.1 PilZ domain-containing protein [Hyphomicrobiales bacterium]
MSAVLQNSVMPRVTERRRHSRVQVNLLGRFMLENKKEYPCQVINMSPGGLAMIAPVRGEIGERIIAYIDHIGRIEGKIVRKIEGGFAVALDATLRKRDKLASQLTWLANRHILNLPEDRRHERRTPKNPITKLVMDDGSEHMCRVLDLSLSGAALKTKVRPAIGKRITIGKIQAQVVRHLEDGLAIEFAALQEDENLDNNLI